MIESNPHSVDTKKYLLELINDYENKLKMTEQKYSTVKIKEKRKQQCSICLDKFSCNEIVYFLGKCKHIYHKKCLDEWVKYKPECPACRDTLELL